MIQCRSILEVGNLKLKEILPEMVRVPYYGDFTTLKKGSWSHEEDEKLKAYIKRYGIWNWTEMPKAAGLLRSGKSCRLRWVNYLKPGIKRGNFSRKEEEIIMNLHKLMGNRWSAIAARLPGRTDNEIKNYWLTKQRKRGGSPSPITKSSLGDKQIGIPKAGRSVGSEHPCSSQASPDDSSSSTSSLVDMIQMEGNVDDPMSIQPYTCDSSSSVTSLEVGIGENQVMEGSMEAGITTGDFQAFPLEDWFMIGDYFWGAYPDLELAFPGCEEWVQDPLWA